MLCVEVPVNTSQSLLARYSVLSIFVYISVISSFLHSHVFRHIPDNYSLILTDTNRFLLGYHHWPELQTERLANWEQERLRNAIPLNILLQYSLRLKRYIHLHTTLLLSTYTANDF